MTQLKEEMNISTTYSGMPLGLRKARDSFAPAKSLATQEETQIRRRLSENGNSHVNICHLRKSALLCMAMNLK